MLEFEYKEMLLMAVLGVEISFDCKMYKEVDEVVWVHL